jgi:hypothetical protein
MKKVGENNAEPVKPPDTVHPARVPDPPTPSPTPGRGFLTLMMLLRLGVARAASRRPASLSAGAPEAPDSATPLRRSLIRPPEATAPKSPEASGLARGSSSPPAASGGARPSLLAAPSAMARQVSGSPGAGGRRHAPQQSPATGHGSAQAPRGSPARLCFTARRRRQL